MPNINCAGCPNIIKNNEYVQCRICSLSYDIICANLTFKKFCTMSKQSRLDWQCQACLNKRPKADNQNTPVRTTSEAHSDVDLAANSSKPSKRSRFTSPEVDLDMDESKESCCRMANLNELIISALRSEVPKILEGSLIKELEPIKNQISDVLSSIEFINKKYEEMSNLLKSREEDIKQLKSENIQLHNTVKDLHSRLGALEQHSREANIEIHGLPEHRSENLAQTVTLIGKAVSHQIQDGDVLSCFRVAEMNVNSNRPRSVVVKLRSPRCRDAFLAAVWSYNKKNQEKLNTGVIGIGGDKKQLYVAEHLSPENKSLHAATRIRAKELSYKFVWVRNGRIYVRKNESSQPKLINNKDSLCLL